MRICEVRMSTDPVTGVHSLTESEKPGYNDKSWMTSVDKGPGTSVRRSGKLTLDKMFVQGLLEVASSQEINPSVDAFASKGMHFFDKYCTKNSDAFKRSWRHEVLWIHPPHHLLPRKMESP